MNETGVSLFRQAGVDSDSSQNMVLAEPYGRDGRLVLRRSEAMDSLIISEVDKVTDDFRLQTQIYDGLIYMVFQEDESQGTNETPRAIPLYIGKAGKFGIGAGNLSANIAAIRANTGKFCRWGYNYAYHMGDLSAVACPGHSILKSNPKYVRWAERLFETFPSTTLSLKRPVKFWIKAWRGQDTGIWAEYGPTSLEFLEYLLIGVAGDLFPDSVLNAEGITRRAPTLNPDNK